MAIMMIFNEETNRPVGEKEIPDDIIEAAAKVAAWMRKNEAYKLYGLRFED